MKVVVFGPSARTGALVGDSVIDLNGACARYLLEQGGEPRAAAMADALVPSDLQGFIEGGPRALEYAERAIEYVTRQAGPPTGVEGQVLVHAARDVRLHAPKPWAGSRIACAGGNYATHGARMQASYGGEKVSAEQMYQQARAAGMWGFWKVGDVVGPDQEVQYPARTKRFDYEGEVAVVLGKAGRDVSQAQARDLIWGVTLLVDWSTRDGMDQPRGMSFNLAKNFDNSTSLGPCIVVGELDPQDVEVGTVVAGEERQHYNTRDMTFSFAEYIEHLSRDFTFKPGDIVSGGTGPGTAMESVAEDGGAKFLQVGQLVEVSSPSIGRLANRIVAKAPLS